MKTIQLKVILAALLTAMCVTFYSCTDDSFVQTVEDEKAFLLEFTPEESRYMLTEQKGNMVNPQEAINRVFEHLGTNMTRGENDLKEVGIIYKEEIGMSKRDTIIPDTLAYLFESKGQSKQFVVSADNRTRESLLAEYDYTETENDTSLTSITIKDIIRKGIANHVRNEILCYEQQKDSMLNEIQQKLNLMNQSDSSEVVRFTRQPYPHEGDPAPEYQVTEYVLHDWHEVEYIAPMIYIRWDQNSPYNNNLANRFGISNYYVGCVPIAAVQIMSYWQKTLYVKNHLVDWENLTRYTHVRDIFPALCEEAADLVEAVYDGCQSEQAYNPDGGSSNINRARNYFLNIGFNADNIQPYSSSAVYQSLANLRPVFMRAENSNYAKHAWNIDGYYKETRTMRRIIRIYDERLEEWVPYQSYDYNIYQTYFHHNWGWGINCVGWLASGCFDYTQLTTAPSTRSATPYSYEYEIEIIPNIYPDN